MLSDMKSAVTSMASLDKVMSLSWRKCLITFIKDGSVSLGRNGCFTHFNGLRSEVRNCLVPSSHTSF